MEFWIDGECRCVAMGTPARFSRGAGRAFRDPVDGPLCKLRDMAPAGFDVSLFRCAAVVAWPSPPDMTKLLAIAAGHRIVSVNETRFLGAAFADLSGLAQVTVIFQACLTTIRQNNKPATGR